MLKDNDTMKCEGIFSEYSDASIVVFGAPYDGTASYRPGSRFGPEAIRSNMDGFETYSPYQDKDMADYAFCDVGDIIFPFGNTQKVLSMIKSETKSILEDCKKTVVLGGEHLISLPVIESYIEKYPDMHIVHFDAHADLRDDYLGEKLSHATVMRRTYEKLGSGKLWQFGIRSGTKDEFEFAREHTHMCRFELCKMEKAVKAIDGAPVYVTIDLDVLDPSVFRGTGTPEPGGVMFTELLEALLDMEGMNIVGADIVELAPDYDGSGASTAAACKVLREMLLLMST